MSHNVPVRGSGFWGRRPPLSGQNCTVIRTDVVGFGARHRTDRDRQVIRREGLAMMQRTLAPFWGACISEDRGDGLLLVVPPQVPTASVMEGLHGELPVALRQHNEASGAAARFRLRVAVNVGPVVSDDLGMSGEAIIRTVRLVEAPVLKAAMAAGEAALGIIVSEFVFDTAVAQLAQAGEYEQVQVRRKEFASPAWMRLVGPAAVPGSALPG
jgi:class 3 adenylate cyclase